MDSINLQKISVLQDQSSGNSPRIWLFNDLIKCGFPSPSEGYADAEIDFNTYIIDRPSSSYCFFVKGDSMEGLHILSGSCNCCVWTRQAQGKWKKLQQAVSEINFRYGRNTVSSLSCGTGNPEWQMRQQKLSPGYTTEINDFPVVSAG